MIESTGRHLRQAIRSGLWQSRGVANQIKSNFIPFCTSKSIKINMIHQNQNNKQTQTQNGRKGRKTSKTWNCLHLAKLYFTNKKHKTIMEQNTDNYYNSPIKKKKRQTDKTKCSKETKFESRFCLNCCRKCLMNF